MITTDLLRKLPARLRAYAGDCTDDEGNRDLETSLVLEQAADVAEELLRLRRWQKEAATVLVVLRRHLTGQEPLDQEHQNIWRQAADALTERRVLREGAEWGRPEAGA